MNLACPSCSTVYRIDPARVPEGGALTRCRECEAPFQVRREAAQAPGVITTARPPRTEPARAKEPSTPGLTPPRRRPQPEEPPAAPAATSAPTAPQEGAPGGAAPVFGPQDPETRARRLARALVSDMKVYNPEKWEESREQGTLRNAFRDEILKSWDEYVEQVGERMAKRTPYFRDALNEILAAGEPVF